MLAILALDLLRRDGFWKEDANSMLAGFIFDGIIF